MKLENHLFCDMFGSVLECYELIGVGLIGQVGPWLMKRKQGLRGSNLGLY